MNQKENEECLEALKQAKETLFKLDLSINQHVIPFLRLGSPKKDKKIRLLTKNYHTKVDSLNKTINDLTEAIKKEESE